MKITVIEIKLALPVFQVMVCKLHIAAQCVSFLEFNEISYNPDKGIWIPNEKSYHGEKISHRSLSLKSL